MDYALRGPDETIVALIEATAPGQDLGGSVTQTLNDAVHAGIPLCVLTTGATGGSICRSMREALPLIDTSQSWTFGLIRLKPLETA